MPPKAAKGDSSAASVLPSDSPLVAAFVAAGLAKAKAESTAKNTKQSAALAKIINDNDITDAAKNPKQGNLLIHLVTVQEQAGASEEGALTEEHVNLVAKAIHDGRLQSADQVNGGCLTVRPSRELLFAVVHQLIQSRAPKSWSLAPPVRRGPVRRGLQQGVGSR